MPARGIGLAGFTDIFRESIDRLFSINENAIAPVVIDGDHWAWMPVRSCEKACLPVKKGRSWAPVLIDQMATAADSAEMADFLASGDADYIVAQTCKVDDGNWIS